jgi:hypothetical protein
MPKTPPKRPRQTPPRRPDRRAQTSRANGRKGGKPTGAGTGPQAATRARAALVQQHAELSQEAVVEQMARGALYDPRGFFDTKGNLIPLHKLTEAQAQCIAGFEVVMKNAAAGDDKVDRVLKYKLVDRAKFVEMAAKLHGLQITKIDATMNVQEIGRRLDAARLRAAKGNTP